jgi:hypothetical protein
MLTTQEERARLLDLRFRVRRGDYDLDRIPDTWPYRLSVWLTANALPLILYSLVTGFGLAALTLTLLLALGG